MVTGVVVVDGVVVVAVVVVVDCVVVEGTALGAGVADRSRSQGGMAWLVVDCTISAWQV